MRVENTKFTERYTKVYCEDDWQYNAPHHFNVERVSDNGNVGHVDFQCGPIKEVGVNGVNNEDLLLMVITRLEAFQKSEFKCDENQEAIDALYEAIDSLHRRTNSRIARGVEGTQSI